MKKTLTLLFCAILLFGFAPLKASAASNSVSVTIPTFQVNINGIKIVEDHLQYPFLVYKGITYFPMTYSDCRFLGLETDWNATTGLSIVSSDISSSYHEDLLTQKNSRQYFATIPRFTVKVNGKKIDNSKEEYPLLSFRNVTYFPMTWRFSVSEFGWKLQFNAKEGLTIQSPNLKITEFKLPTKMALIDDGDKTFSKVFTFASGYFYYQGEKGIIYQVSIEDPTKIKKVYTLPAWTYGSNGQLVLATLKNTNGVAVLSYHQGGAAVGTDVFDYFHADGTYDEKYDMEKEIKALYKDETVSIYIGPYSEFGNLGIYKTIDDGVQIGSSDYYYVGPMRIVGDDIYVLGHDRKYQSNVYRVNIKTKETTPLGMENAVYFEILGDKIYYVINHTLYSRPLGGDSTAVPIKLADSLLDENKPVLLEQTLYYVSMKEGKPMLYKLNAKNSLNPGASVTQIKEDGGYLIATFKEDSSSKYRLMVFNKTSKLVLKTSDIAENVTIEKGILCYINTDSKVCMVTLPQ